jgi:glycosyltransferase involved in cell wall biosynthesis
VNARRLSVLVVTPKGDLGGAERWLLAVGDAAPGLTMAVVVLEQGPIVAELQGRGWPTWSRTTGKALPGLWQSFRWLGTVISEVRPDVILLNGVKPGLLALPWARRRHIPVVLVKHGTAFERSLTPVVVRGCAACIAVSDEHAGALPPAKTTVIPPARPAQIRSRLRARGEPLALLMATRLVPNKGVDTAITAIAHAGWELEVAGPDDPGYPGERSRLQDLAASLGVTSRVHFLGEVPGITALLEHVDAVAVLSRPDEAHPTPAEGFGMVVIEAASAGVPVIADPEQVPSVAALGGAGVVPVRATDQASVEAALDSLADDTRRHALSEAGLRAVRQHPGPEEVAARVTDVLAGVLR